MSRSLDSKEKVAIVGLIIGLSGLFVSIITGPLWTSVSAGLVLLASISFLISKWLILIFKWLHCQMTAVSPWLILIVLALTLLILFLLWPAKKPVQIIFDRAKGAIFNSGQHAPHGKHIVAWGAEGSLDWVIADGGRTGSFHYRADPKILESQGATSGGYMTFYGRHFDRLQYRIVRLSCKATNTAGIADVGLRLVVDDPHAIGDRELVTYDLLSLRAVGPIDSKWRSFEIRLSDFKQVRYKPPFPKNLDENTINKIVFFVDNRIVEVCPEGTLWFADVEIQP